MRSAVSAQDDVMHACVCTCISALSLLCLHVFASVYELQAFHSQLPRCGHFIPYFHSRPQIALNFKVRERLAV